jgi:uncharacterized protein (DUF427 family)
MGTDERGRVRIEDAAKRVRAYLGGELVADTTAPTLVWEVPYYPAYYLPEGDVRMELLTPNGHTERSPSRGEARYFDVRGGGKVAPNAAWQYPDSPLERLRGLIRLDWASMDAWFEEDEQVYVHPRSPYTRVDILPSSRHVEVVVDGVKIADSARPTLLFETGLPTRYYLPFVDVRMDLLRPSDTKTHCPYKGTASYWSVEINGEVRPDVIWTYPTPLHESARIAGLAAFWNERADIYVDGVLQERPRTVFSKADE